MSKSRFSLMTLTKVTDWIIANTLTLNKSKRKFMSIGRQTFCTLIQPPSPVIDGSSAKHVVSTKSLCIYIDDNLSWSTNADNISKRLLLHGIVPFETLLCIYNALGATAF